MMMSNCIYLPVIISCALLYLIEPSFGAGFCDGKASGNYQDPDNCYGFIACSNQIAYKMNCSVGLKYNKKTGLCDWPQNVRCPVNGGWSDWSAWGPCSVTCNGGSQTRSRSCTNPLSSNGERQCTGPATETRQCGTFACPSFCQGKADGNYKNPNNCYRYIACGDGVTYNMRCPAGLKYDEQTDKCDYLENVTC